MKPFSLVPALRLFFSHTILVNILSVSAITLLTVSQTYGQGSFRLRNPPNARRIIGNIAIPVGAVVATCGGYLYLATGPVKAGQAKRPPDPLGVAGIAGGIVLVAGGITLLAVDKAHHRKHGWSVTTSKNNEIGIAYNF